MFITIFIFPLASKRISTVHMKVIMHLLSPGYKWRANKKREVTRSNLHFESHSPERPKEHLEVGEIIVRHDQLSSAHRAVRIQNYHHKKGKEEAGRRFNSNCYADNEK